MNRSNIGDKVTSTMSSLTMSASIAAGRIQAVRDAKKAQQQKENVFFAEVGEQRQKATKAAKDMYKANEDDQAAKDASFKAGEKAGKTIGDIFADMSITTYQKEYGADADKFFKKDLEKAYSSALEQGGKAYAEEYETNFGSAPAKVESMGQSLTNNYMYERAEGMRPTGNNPERIRSYLENKREGGGV